MSTVLDGELAWRSLAGAGNRQWEEITARFAEPVFTLKHQPKFTLSTQDKFFCIGSCFARNIEEHLIYRGVDVLSRRIIAPRSEWPGPRPNGMVNKFTTHSMVQELEWVIAPPEDFEAEMVESPHGYFDLQLCPGVAPVPLPRAVERRRYLINDYFARIREATVCVITLGLNEVWRDATVGRYLNTSPTIFAIRKNPSRFSVEVTDASENIAQLERLLAMLRTLNPSLKIVVTVSPVPMFATFSGQDIACANALSKSTLLSAARTFESAHDFVDYFPSFELVTLSDRHTAFGSDCLHVTNAVVGKAMEVFLQSYMSNSPPAPEGFVDLAYLEANPDVEDAVREGKFASGFEHWINHGKDEGRVLRPDQPTARMIEAGV